MTNQHSVTALSDLIEQLELDIDRYEINTSQALARAYAAGADQELEACVGWLISNQNPRWAAALQEGRRPKPLTLKEQALEALDEERADMSIVNYKTIRSVLESFPE